MIWILVLVAVAALSGVLGFAGVSEALADLAKIVFFGCVAVVVLVLFTARPLNKRSGKPPQLGKGEDAPKQ